jgi:putative spermidine/putrescine transport system substrate-binding protein
MHNSRPIAIAYIVHYVLVYRREAFPNGKPESWSVLLDSRHRGRVALYPGGNGLYAIAQVLEGGSLADIPNSMEPCWNFVRKIAGQIRRLDYSIALTDSIRAGEVDLCLRALPNALAFQREGLSVDWVAPREGVPHTMDALWVPRGLPDNRSYWASQYIDFALSLPVQERWCEALGVLPIHPGAKLPSLYRESNSLPRYINDTELLLYISDLLKADYEESWEELFSFHISSEVDAN